MARTTNGRVLLVEDNKPIARLMNVILDNAGYTVITENSGGAGLAAIRAQRPDLVLLDLELPDMDGFAVLAQARRDGATADTRIVAFTSHTDVSAREEVTRAGFDGYISKPIDPDAFIAQVEKFLAND